MLGNVLCITLNKIWFQSPFDSTHLTRTFKWERGREAGHLVRKREKMLSRATRADGGGGDSKPFNARRDSRAALIYIFSLAGAQTKNESGGSARDDDDGSCDERAFALNELCFALLPARVKSVGQEDRSRAYSGARATALFLIAYLHTFCASVFASLFPCFSPSLSNLSASASLRSPFRQGVHARRRFYFLAFDFFTFTPSDFSLRCLLSLLKVFFSSAPIRLP